MVALLAALAPQTQASNSVTISEEVDEGSECFRIVTPAATYFYDKAGAGFTSILDREGVDWIDFHPPGTPGIAHGDAGWYRGIPNMNADFGHPGYTGAQSTTTDPKGTPLPKATVRSVKHDWSVTWEFFPNYAKMTVESIADSYWLLYEGVPGGAISRDGMCWRSGGDSNRCDEPWEDDIIPTSVGDPLSNVEWVSFADRTLERSLFLAHGDDGLTDRYYVMNSMTVFGFGRRSPSRVERWLRALGMGSPDLALMRQVPEVLVIGFVDSVDREKVRQHLATIYDD